MLLTRAYCWVVSRLHSEEGATAVEYGVMVALIAIVIIATVVLLGKKLDAVFNKVLIELTAIVP